MEIFSGNATANLRAQRRFNQGLSEAHCRNIHAAFQAKMAEKPHGYCVDSFCR
jgi:hypothetical protein